MLYLRLYSCLYRNDIITNRKVNLPMIFVDGAAVFTVIARDFVVVPVGIGTFSLAATVVRCTVVECDLGVVLEFITVSALHTIKTLLNNTITVKNFIATCLDA